MDTLAESDELEARSPRPAAEGPPPPSDGGEEAVVPRPADEEAEARPSDVTTERGGTTPPGEPSLPGEGIGFTQQRIGAMVLGRLFGRTPAATRIGRFVVLDRIGRGGMGTVYAAYDEQLDRKVAVKVLARERSGDVARRRLQREAQAMARLSHPNVVTVHEVGESDGEVFLAMEFIRGRSLDAWIRTSPSWREVLEVFVQAGRGLIAAHEAGLVHRDLKPHNIMRGDDGVVKVLDFGLARAAGDELDDSEEVREVSGSGSGSGSVLASDLTRTGAVLGTPAYMSPEQHRGLTADARSDQFSFCVALYEALHGRRPFQAPTLVALVQSVLSGEIAEPPSDSRVPTWLHRIVVRGLCLEPAERWPSMRALVQQLERDRSRVRRRWAGFGVGAVMVGALGFGLATMGDGGPEPCPPAEAEREALWPAERRQRVAAAFASTHSALADPTLERVGTMIDEYTGALGRMRTDACEAHRRGEHSERLFDLRTACLDVRRAGVEELLASLEQADAGTVSNAAWAAASLRSIDACADTEALTSAVPPPEDERVAARVQAEREALASAASRRLAGDYDGAREQAEATLSVAESLEYAPLVAEAELELGAALMESHQFELARESLTKGLVVALRSGHDEVAVEALARRMWVLADPLRRPAEAIGDDEIADALLGKLGRPTRLQWLLLNNRGVARFRGGRRVEAERDYRDALAVLEAEGSELFPVQDVSTRFNLAMLLSEGLGEPDAAAAELRAARERAVELLGVEHPRVGVISVSLIADLVSASQYEAAREELEAGLARWTDPLLRSAFLLERANLELELRRYPEARRDAEEVLAAVGVEGLGTVVLSLKGVARVGQGEVEPGLVTLREAVALETSSAEPDPKAVAVAHLWLGHGLRLAGRLDEAAQEQERARVALASLGLEAAPALGRRFFEAVSLELERGELPRAAELLAHTRRAQDEASFGDGNLHRTLAAVLDGELRAARGDTAGARAILEVACPALAERVGRLAPELARCRLALARVLGPSPAGRAHAARAAEALELLGEGFEHERAEASARASGGRLEAELDLGE